jgi:hypothetical protein
MRNIGFRMPMKKSNIGLGMRFDQVRSCANLLDLPASLGQFQTFANYRFLSPND